MKKIKSPRTYAHSKKKLPFILTGAILFDVNDFFKGIFMQFFQQIRKRSSSVLRF
jgi:hypothetical protein